MIDKQIKELDGIIDSDIIIPIDEINSKLLNLEKYILKIENKYNSIQSTTINDKNDSDKNDSDINIILIKNKLDLIDEKVNYMINSNKNIEDIIDAYAEFKKELLLLEQQNNEFVDLNLEYV